jgi:hypothetical protein
MLLRKQKKTAADRHMLGHSRKQQQQQQQREGRWDSSNLGRLVGQVTRGAVPGFNSGRRQLLQLQHLDPRHLAQQQQLEVALPVV